MLFEAIILSQLLPPGALTHPLKQAVLTRLFIMIKIRNRLSYTVELWLKNNRFLTLKKRV